MVLRPLCQDVSRGIQQIDLDALAAGEIKRDRSLGQISQRHLDCELADFRELHGLGRDLQIESEPTQPRILVPAEQRLEKTDEEFDSTSFVYALAWPWA